MIRLLPRAAGAIALLALLLTPLGLTAQDDAITVVGSGIVAPIIEAFVDVAELSNVDLSVTGTNSGFETFCSGGADIALATRAINQAEEIRCAESNVDYLELLVGHSIVALVASPESSAPECLTASELDTLFAPSARDQIVNFNQLNPEFADASISLVLPASDSAAYAQLDNVIGGEGLRADAVSESDSESVLAAVSSTENAIGVVPFPAASAAGDSVRIIEIDPIEGSGCALPSAEGVENRLYPAADRLYAYVNVGSVGDEGMTALLNAINGEGAAQVVTDAGFTPVTEAALATNADIVANTSVGRQFSRDVTGFEIQDQIFGSITIGGSAHAFEYIQNVTTAFTSQYPGVTTEIQMLGEANGLERLCARDLDIAVAYRQPNEEQLTACTEGNVAFETINLGSEAVVLVGNAGTEFLSCLTTEQLATLWRAEAENTVTNWNQVDESFADLPIFLFAPGEGDSAADLLMIQSTGVASPLRPDVAETNADPLYRAAATANVEGALTFMDWNSYQQVLDNNQANIQLVGVGEGCVQPSEATIEDGSYPLVRPLHLLVYRLSMGRPEVQSLLWYIISDENYTLLQDAGLVGLGFGELPDLRARLQTVFDQAELEFAVAAEATPEPDATEEPTAEATASE